jgi:predicted phage tail protein
MRLTQDYTDESRYQTHSYVSSYVTYIDGKFSMPETCAIGLEIAAQQFGNTIPERMALWDGYNAVHIPSNYDPIARTYSGAWNGTFTTGWTNNPAWWLYELSTNSDMNPRACDPSRVDKWELYEIAKYCDQMIDNGAGGTEPRFTLNMVIGAQEDAFKLISAIASSCHTMVYWGPGAVSFSQDRPGDVTHIAHTGNVIDGLFTYTGTARSSRHSVSRVTWNDPSNFYQPSIAIFEDPEMVGDFGWIAKDEVAVGCTSYGQAIRQAKWTVDTEKNQYDVLTFKGGFYWADCRPGNIIEVQDPWYAGVHFGGKVASATSTSITFDRPVTFTGSSYSIQVVLSDGTVEERALGTLSGTYSTVTVSAWSSIPEPNADWVITATSVNPRQFRVLANVYDKNIFEITALFHDPNKYARIEQGIFVDPPSYTDLPTGALPAPTGLAAKVYSYEENNNFLQAILFSWTPVDDIRVTFYEVQVDEGQTGTWQGAWPTNNTSTSSIDIFPTKTATYNLRVRSMGMGTPSKWATLIGTGVEYTGHPPDVSNLRTRDGGATFSGRDCGILWDTVIGQDFFPRSRFDYYELEIQDPITHAVKRTVQCKTEEFTYTWGMNSDDFGAASRSFRVSVVAVDIFGNKSETPAILDATNPAPSMAGYTPSTDAMFTGMSIYWKTFTVQDPDFERYEVRVEASDHVITPTPSSIATVAGFVSAPADGYFYAVPVDSPDVVYYYCQVIPWDVFGAGAASNVTYGVSDPSDLITILEGQISESQLTADLLAQIENAGVEDMDIIAAMANGNWPTAYNAATNYALGDWCSYDNGSTNDVYVVKLETPTAGIVPTNTTYWRKAYEIVQTFFDRKKVDDVLSSDINTLDGAIQLRALKGTLTDQNYTLAAAEQDISAVEGAITSKVWMSDIDLANEEVYTVQSEVAQKANEWTVKIDANGNCVGMGLIAYPNWSDKVTYAHPSMVYYASTGLVYKTKSAPPKGTVPTNTTYWQSTVTSKDQVIFRTTTFAIVHGDTPTDLKYPFMIGQTPAGTTVGINGQMVVDGTISADSIRTEELYIPYSQITGTPTNTNFLIRASGASSSSGTTSYLKTGDGVTTIFGPTTSPATGTSWNLAIYDCTTDAWVHREAFNIYTTPSKAEALYNLINANYYDPRYLIALFTNDEPRKNVFSDTLTYDPSFIQTLIDLGATRQFLNSTDFKIRSAYVLLGKWHQGEGRGFQWYAGTTDNSSSAQINLTVGIDRYRKEWVQVTPPHVAPNVGITPFRMQAPPAGTPGLWLQPSQMGYYNGSEWRAYIQSDGKFYFGGETGKYLWYNGSTLAIRGALVADDITSGTLSADRITAGTLHANKITANTIDYGQIYTSGTSGAVSTVWNYIPGFDITISNATVSDIGSVYANVDLNDKIIVGGYAAMIPTDGYSYASGYIAIERILNSVSTWIGAISSSQSPYRYAYNNICILDVPNGTGTAQYRFWASGKAWHLRGIVGDDDFTYNGFVENSSNHTVTNRRFWATRFRR